MAGRVLPENGMVGADVKFDRIRQNYRLPCRNHRSVQQCKESGGAGSC